jgi:hypothetical protein
VWASAGSAALAVLAGVTWTGTTAAGAAQAVAAGVTLSASPLGLDVAPWDGTLASGSPYLSQVDAYLKAAGIDNLHYTGGVMSDAYNWQTNTDITKCPDTKPAGFTAACATDDALPFYNFSLNARAIGAKSLVTVNYGTGSTAMVGNWAHTALTAPGEGVADWEIGNESYGCWENNNWLADAPANYKGYVPTNDATCPMTKLGTAQGTTLMAQSYAAHAGAYMTAMKAADPNAKIGIPWAFDGTVGGAAVADNTAWNNTILAADAANISFVDAHWYAFGSTLGAHPNPQVVLKSLFTIPSEYAKIRATLNTYDPAAAVIVGETGVSFLPTNAPCTPTGALFAAGDALSWLAAGAQTVDWWPLVTFDNMGSACTLPDEAMFTGNGTPLSPYYGYLLASALTQPGAKLSTVSTSDNANVLAFQSVLPNGRVAVALINIGAAAEHVGFTSSLAGNLTTQTYTAANQNASNSNIVPGTSTASAVSGGITLPAESIVILKEATLKPAALALGSAISGNTFTAGKKVALKGKLTLNGAAAPAGAKIKVVRKASGKVKAITLAAKTVAGGTFTVTDIPPATGTYTYLASYLSSTYVPVSAAHAVKVTAAKPSIKLAVSAKSVKPGAKVTVTATFASTPHVNRTLAIYAQRSGTARKLIARAAFNAKGQLKVVFSVKANTTFTVIFAGDTWYKAASATAGVKA